MTVTIENEKWIAIIESVTIEVGNSIANPLIPINISIGNSIVIMAR